MKDNIIWSIYIDKNDIKKLPTTKYDLEKTDASNIYKLLKDNIINNHQTYAKYINADYHIALYDESFFGNFSGSLYNRINDYKFFVGEQLASVYKKVLYLDFDAVFNTTDNFFDQHDFNYLNALIHPMVKFPSKQIAWNLNINQSKSNIRKAYYTQVALEHLNYDIKDNEFFLVNTGVMGYNKTTIQKLNYFNIFKTLEPFLDSQEDELALENETPFTSAAIYNNVPLKCLKKEWNQSQKKNNYIGKIIHFLQKEKMKTFFNYGY